LTGSGGPSRAIEGGIVDLDSDLEQPIQALKQETEAAQAARERMVVQARTSGPSLLPGCKEGDLGQHH
jgi:hypothetical protein